MSKAGAFAYTDRGCARDQNNATKQLQGNRALSAAEKRRLIEDDHEDEDENELD
jgi:hypothetical protein